MEAIGKEPSEFNAAFKFTIDVNSGFIEAGKLWSNRNYRGVFDLASGLQIILKGYIDEDMYIKLDKQFLEINSLFNRHSFQINKGSYPEDLVLKVKNYLEELVFSWKESGLQNKSVKDRRYAISSR